MAVERKVKQGAYCGLGPQVHGYLLFWTSQTLQHDEA